MGGGQSFPIVRLPRERIVIVTGSNAGTVNNKKVRTLATICNFSIRNFRKSFKAIIVLF